MCGIAGVVGQSLEHNKSSIAIHNMVRAIAHRGPNSEGIWHNDDTCYLGHRRLSIIDLSEAGNQPFHSFDNRYVIVYNGELYNYRDIKLDLQRVAKGSSAIPYVFKTNTDTEVILAAYMRWGKDCLHYLNGMFAFAIWDTLDKRLFVARDRLGVKPFYYSYVNNTLLFASELRAILKSDYTSFSINKKSISEYIQYQTVHAPQTIVKDIYMLMPGHYMEYYDGQLTTAEYWNINKYINQSHSQSYKETCATVNALLTASVERRLVADVPFGAFLSGGIDSSAVVGLMSKVSSEKVQTFSVTFDEQEFSEAQYAAQIAKRFSTEHHEIKLTSNDFLNTIPEALLAMDHPSGDGPNTYVVSKATKDKGITMALSGLGGDELFAGYPIFKRLKQLQGKQWMNSLPPGARKLGGTVISYRKKSIEGDKLQEILRLQNIDSRSVYPINRKTILDKELQTIIRSEYNSTTNLSEQLKSYKTDSMHILSLCSAYEISTYMQNTLLRDTDQMSMAVALEVREPFLDYQLVEYVLGVNDEYKYPHTPKKLLTDALGDLLPREIINRPKMGFTLPWKEWLKHDLKLFCEHHITSLAKRDFINEKGLMELWQRFLQGDARVTWSRVWHLVVLEHWLQTNTIN